MDTINRYIKEGVIIQIPKKRDNKLELFKYVSTIFEDDVVYSEKEVNEMLCKLYRDYALLRRYLVDFKLLERDEKGANYRKAVSDE